MHDPMTQICSWPSYEWREKMLKKWWMPKFLIPEPIFTLWHVDPCKRKGRNIKGDDTCGWFKRAGHGDAAVLARIERRFEEDWDRTFKSDSGKEYWLGYFYPPMAGAGMPNMSVHGITLNLFYSAAHEYFRCDGRTNWKKSRRFMEKNLFDILFFAENPTDSLRDSICRVWDTPADDKLNPRQVDAWRKERIHRMAAIVYGYIIRRDEKWWQHPRWHIHHWKFQFHKWEEIKRWLTTRCVTCGKRIPLGTSTVHDHKGLHCNRCF